ncbi:MAG TPA: hypothetical protein VKG26_14900 [Bacteroidia bacterium]|nr:hypothetical protein [Bacteroidia bacterium]
MQHDNWMIPIIPNITFEEFNDNLCELVLTIENWLENHSGIKLNLKLEEPNQVISNRVRENNK